MIIGWLLALVLGAVLGYTMAQRASRRQWQKTLEQQQAALRGELDAAKEQLKALRQENADLSYKLGESEKTRRYLEASRRDNNNNNNNNNTDQNNKNP